MHDHNHFLVLVAAAVCVVGSCLTVRIILRLLLATGRRKWVQLTLSSLIGGLTIWSTHFIAMLAFDPHSDHGYEPVMTSVSLVIAIAGLFAANSVMAFGRMRASYFLAGTVFGLSVSVMHYLGMMAYLLPGQKEWNAPTVMMSMAFGIVLGSASYHRIAFPWTRYCWWGGAALMVLAICSMHFIGMGGFSVVPVAGYVVPDQLLSDQALAFLVVTITAVVLFISFSALSIETYLEREAEERLEQTSTRDPLTGLPNRVFLAREIGVLSDCLASDTAVQAAVLSIDLDKFKQINDLWGRKFGDEIIQKVAKRMARSCTVNDLIVHTGGDEFVVLITEFTGLAAALTLARNLLQKIESPIEMQGVSIALTASIGIATTIEDGRDLQTVMQRSDLAMYRAKLDGGGRIYEYNAGMERESRDRLLLINDLKLAAEAGQLSLVYQLQNDIRSLAPVGFEALLRWHHPQQGLIGPNIFIPLAEETGLICDIGLWVLRTACHEAASWFEPLTIAVNVAPQQLVQPGFIEQLSDALLESGLEPERLELEVTEASIIDDQAVTLDVMGRIKEMGVRIAMDDFGTGYSSLSALQAFPFDKIKIDRSFVQNAHLNHQRAAIVRAALLLGKALEIPVLAEGVECLEELNFLKAQNCTSVQGFYFGKPMAVENARLVAGKPVELKVGTC